MASRDQPTSPRPDQEQPPLDSPEALVRAIAAGHILDAAGLQRAKVALARLERGDAFHSNANLLALARRLARRGELSVGMRQEAQAGPGPGREDDVGAGREDDDENDREGDNEAAQEAALRRVERVLRRKPVRTLAGVAPVAVMTSPAACPHGTCVYCPGGLEAQAGPMAVAGDWQHQGTPQSYTGHEPAARRAAMHDYDARDQTRARLGQYVANGHPVDKVDLIVMGGTFTSRSQAYQLQFIIGAFQGLNLGPLTEENELSPRTGPMAGPVAALPGREEATGTVGKALERGHASPGHGPVAGSQVQPSNIIGGGRAAAPGSWLSSEASLSAIANWQELRAAHAANETARSRCIGLTLETRPDQCSPRQVARMVKMGTTRVELGVQVLDDGVLKAVGRAHTVEDIARATAALKTAGLKVCYHIMPGLPGMTPATDIAAFELLWDDQRFRPDLLKLYPCLVVEGAALAGQWEAGEYTPYDNAKAIEVVSRMKALVPPFVRLQRIQRDIPVHQILAGVTAGNLRQLARKALNERGEPCQCIRCSEAGLKGLSDDGTTSNDAMGTQPHHTKDSRMNETKKSQTNQRKDSPKKNIELKATVLKYQASGGIEKFLAYRDQDQTLYGYCRLRLEAGNATVRELKVVGQTVPLEKAPAGEPKQHQHHGLGRHLMLAAETQARRAGHSSLRVTAGVGVRPYYRSLGYHFHRNYMVKEL